MIAGANPCGITPIIRAPLQSAASVSIEEAADEGAPLN